MENQCYYCGQIFELRTDLYDHLTTHAKISSKQVAKNEIENNTAKINENQEAKKADSKSSTDIRSIKKQIDEIQKRIEST